MRQFLLEESLETQFTGYETHHEKAKIIGLIVHNQSVLSVEPGTDAYVITDKSPFFVECGGQVSDQGVIKAGGIEMPLRGLKKIDHAIGAFVEIKTSLHVGDMIDLNVDSPTRINTMKNHTATHLLQAALIDLLGKQVKQSGSLVDPDYLRFDFTYHENLTPEQITVLKISLMKKLWKIFR